MIKKLIAVAMLIATFGGGGVAHPLIGKGE